MLLILLYNYRNYANQALSLQHICGIHKINSIAILLPVSVFPNWRKNHMSFLNQNRVCIPCIPNADYVSWFIEHSELNHLTILDEVCKLLHFSDMCVCVCVWTVQTLGKFHHAKEGHTYFIKPLLTLSLTWKSVSVIDLSLLRPISSVLRAGICLKTWYGTSGRELSAKLRYSACPNPANTDSGKELKSWE
jgi:hypothetical protein